MLLDELIDHISQYSTGLSIVLGALAITGVMWRKFLRPLLKAVLDLNTMMGTLNVLVQAQLNTNGGSSLLDKVNKIEPFHQEVKAHLEMQDRHLETIDAQLAAGTHRFDVLEANQEGLKTTGDHIEDSQRRVEATRPTLTINNMGKEPSS